MWYLHDPHPGMNHNILAAQTQMRCKIRSSTPFRGKYGHKKRNRNGHVCIHYGIFYGAGDRTRTGTLSPAADFESATSTISSHRQVCIAIFAASRRWLYIVAALRRRMSPSFAVPDDRLGGTPSLLVDRCTCCAFACIRHRRRSGSQRQILSATSTISSHRQVLR